MRLFCCSCCCCYLSHYVVVNKCNLLVMEAAVEFLWWLVVVVMGGVQSHFHVLPNYSVEVVLCCVGGVVTTSQLESVHLSHCTLPK